MHNFKYLLVTIPLIFSQVSNAELNIEECDGPTWQWLNCLDELAKEAKAELEEAYSELKSKTTEPDTTNLIKAQKAWLEYKAVECAFYVSPQELCPSGAFCAAEETMCDIEMSKRRTSVLKDYLDKGGCGSCRW